MARAPTEPIDEPPGVGPGTQASPTRMSMPKSKHPSQRLGNLSWGPSGTKRPLSILHQSITTRSASTMCAKPTPGSVQKPRPRLSQNQKSQKHQRPTTLARTVMQTKTRKQTCHPKGIDNDNPPPCSKPTYIKAWTPTRKQQSQKRMRQVQRSPFAQDRPSLLTTAVRPHHHSNLAFLERSASIWDIWLVKSPCISPLCASNWAATWCCSWLTCASLLCTLSSSFDSKAWCLAASWCNWASSASNLAVEVVVEARSQNPCQSPHLGQNEPPSPRPSAQYVLQSVASACWPGDLAVQAAPHYLTSRDLPSATGQPVCPKQIPSYTMPW